MNIFRLTMALSALAALSACSTIPKPIAGKQYQEEPLPVQLEETSVGKPVRWAGTIIETKPESDRTCIEVLARQLDRSASPRLTDQGFGRFIACHDSFIDPAVFANGHHITAVGTIESLDSGRIGDFDYRYPVVKSDAIYLWADQRSRAIHPYPVYGSFRYHRGFRHGGFRYRGGLRYRGGFLFHGFRGGHHHHRHYRSSRGR